VVSDGVGGWANQGVDPGLFSKQLVKDIQFMNDKVPEETLKNFFLQGCEIN